MPDNMFGKRSRPTQQNSGEKEPSSSDPPAPKLGMTVAPGLHISPEGMDKIRNMDNNPSLPKGTPDNKLPPVSASTLQGGSTRIKASSMKGRALMGRNDNLCSKNDFKTNNHYAEHTRV